jgi:hypothetical protein
MAQMRLAKDDDVVQAFAANGAAINTRRLIQSPRRAEEYRGRHSNAEQLRGLQIDHKLELTDAVAIRL